MAADYQAASCYHPDLRLHGRRHPCLVRQGYRDSCSTGSSNNDGESSGSSSNNDGDSSGSDSMGGSDRIGSGSSSGSVAPLWRIEAP